MWQRQRPRMLLELFQRRLQDRVPRPAGASMRRAPVRARVPQRGSL